MTDDALAFPLDVANVAKRFGSFVAVDDVSLRVSRGEVVGLLGANGAGKTTLMRIVLGLLRPDSGAVRVFGDAPGRATRSRLGYVPQGLGLYGDLTIDENLAFVARAFGRKPAKSSDEGVRLAGRETVEAASLGLRRRTAFAAALSHDPDLLVLDEPTSGVDPLARAQLWETIRGAASAGAAVLVSTHYMEEAQNCDRLILMRTGRVVASGTVSDIVSGHAIVAVSSERLDDVFSILDADGIDCLKSQHELRVVTAAQPLVAQVLARAGVTATFTTKPATFEEAFVQIVTETVAVAS